MAASAKAGDSPLVPCEVCMKEVPLTEATVPEASDYVAYFCGLECYAKWKGEPGKVKEKPAAPATASRSDR